MKSLIFISAVVASALAAKQSLIKVTAASELVAAESDQRVLKSYDYDYDYYSGDVTYTVYFNEGNYYIKEYDASYGSSTCMYYNYDSGYTDNSCYERSDSEDRSESEDYSYYSYDSSCSSYDYYYGSSYYYDCGDAMAGMVAFWAIYGALYASSGIALIVTICICLKRGNIKKSA